MGTRTSQTSPGLTPLLTSLRTSLNTSLRAVGWVPALLTGAKSFRDNPVIGSQRLNQLGLHRSRVLRAHSMAAYRQKRLQHFMPENERQRLAEDGYVVLERYLNADHLQRLLDELPNVQGQAREMRQGDTLTQRMLLSAQALADTPLLRAVVQSRALNDRLMYAEAKAHLPLIYLQRIRNGHAGGDRVDPQKTLHADTFHPTMKAWLYLQDVTEDIGPLTYVPGSHRLTTGRLAFEYDRSLIARSQPDRYSEKGSFRLHAEDSARYGFRQPKKLTVPAGSLVIANTFGFHGRGAAVAGADRMELFAYGRTNPFTPWTGSPSFGQLALEQRILTAYWDRQGLSATAKGKRATWHPIASDVLIA